MACVLKSLKYLFSSLMWTKFAHPWGETGGRDILGSGQRRPLCGRDFELKPNDGEKEKINKKQTKGSNQNKQYVNAKALG